MNDKKQTPAPSQAPAAPVTIDNRVTTYEVAGQEVKLSFSIVRNYLTKGNGNVTDQDLVQFINICRYNKLNPFLNEAYLVKFGSNPAQMIVSKEAMFKRAEENPAYEGIQSGIIVDRNGEVVELEGCFKRADDSLLGGWAKVYRSDRKFPIVARVNFDEYDKQQSLWKEKRSTMIAKVAKVQALREAFPQQLGAMFAAEESAPQVLDVDATEMQTVADKTHEYARRAMAKARDSQPLPEVGAERLSLEKQREIMDSIPQDQLPIAADPATGELF